jgi:hypothetical protein
MGIGSYKDAQRYRMRKDKNLTRTFYLDTKRTLDEEPFAWEQVQNTPSPETDYQTEVDSEMVVPPQDVLPKNPIPNMPSAPGIPDPQFRQIELADGGSVEVKKSKAIPMDIESVAFRLFQDKLDNLSYNQKQTVYDYIEDSRNKKAKGGSVETENFYQSEMPAQNIEETNPEIIIKQAILKEKDSDNIKTLNYMLEILREKKNEEQEYKKLQKEKGVRYVEDFPTSSGFGFENVPYEYLKETAKQTLTNPKYFGSNLLKGAAEGTEFLVGQPLQTLFNQEGKNFELYEPTAGEKLGINKLIEKYTPKNPTTGTLVMGKAAEITGSLSDPFLVYGVGKKILPKKVKKNRKNVEENLIEDLMNGTLKPYSDY